MSKAAMIDDCKRQPAASTDVLAACILILSDLLCSCCYKTMTLTRFSASVVRVQHMMLFCQPLAMLSWRQAGCRSFIWPRCSRCRACIIPLWTRPGVCSFTSWRCTPAAVGFTPTISPVIIASVICRAAIARTICTTLISWFTIGWSTIPSLRVPLPACAKLIAASWTVH